jgi:hypothetical protein
MRSRASPDHICKLISSHRGIDSSSTALIKYNLNTIHSITKFTTQHEWEADDDV